MDKFSGVFAQKSTCLIQVNLVHILYLILWTVSKRLLLQSNQTDDLQSQPAPLENGPLSDVTTEIYIPSI